jgi:CBS domain-containing protein
MQVREIMNRKVKVVRHNQTVAEAAREMAAANCGALPVERDDKMVGMITDRDIVLRVVAENRSPEKLRVEECMTKGVDYCYEDDEVSELAEKMATSRHRRIPVVNQDKRLTGIVSLKELATKGRDSKMTGKTVAKILN